MDKFVDSNVIVYAFTNNPNKQTCREIIRKERITLNSLVLVESYSKIRTIADRETAELAIKTLYRLGNIEILDLDQNLFFEAMKRSEKYDLHISDLIHYATALLTNCEEIISYDDHFDNLEIERTTP